jgi:HupE / UreJ protein
VQTFLVYLRLGFDHITDLAGYDHILFVIALCAVYTLLHWRQVLVLVTAFTLGHSLTLALATLRLVNYSIDLIELLIPITIFITAVVNLIFPAPPIDLSNPTNQLTVSQNRWSRYGLALSFGLIHGLGFSSYLRSLLGREADIIGPLFAFNLGLELGQLLIVTITLSISAIVVGRFGLRQRVWTRVVAGGVAVAALWLIRESIR